MGSHLPKIRIELEVRDQNGKLIEKQVRKSKTWVKNFLNLLKVQMSGSAETMYDTSGTSRSVSTDSLNFRVSAGIGEAIYGIQVGTSDTAYSIEDYKLGSQIMHGTGAGQMQYGACDVTSLIPITGGYLFRVIRTFTNSSGASITVKEVGLVSTKGSYYLLNARDVITPITVPNGSTLTVRYIISFTV